MVNIATYKTALEAIATAAAAARAPAGAAPAAAAAPADGAAPAVPTPETLLTQSKYENEVATATYQYNLAKAKHDEADQLADYAVRKAQWDAAVAAHEGTHAAVLNIFQIGRAHV